LGSVRAALFFFRAMNRSVYLATIAAGMLLVLSATLGGAYYLQAAAPRKPWPKPTPPPPPSPVFTPSKERAPTAEEIAAEAAVHNHRLALEIERALVARDPQDRETAFTFLLPELVQVEPQRVVDMVAEQEPGEARDTLRTELARQWISRDRDAAIEWIQSLDAGERRASAYAAMQAIAPTAPEQAMYLAERFDIGRDDGYLEHLIQIWAAADLEGAKRWLAAQPPGPRRDQLAARIDHARRQAGARDRSSPE
jgi:hypothetical protein